MREVKGFGGVARFATLVCLGQHWQLSLQIVLCSSQLAGAHAPLPCTQDECSNLAVTCKLINLCSKLMCCLMLRLPDMQQQECSNLMEVVRELTDSRSKLVCVKTNLAEQLAELRHDYMRVARVADLSRTVSKENVVKAAKAQKSLRQVSRLCKGLGSAPGNMFPVCMTAEVVGTMCG